MEDRLLSGRGNPPWTCVLELHGPGWRPDRRSHASHATVNVDRSIDSSKGNFYHVSRSPLNGSEYLSARYSSSNGMVDLVRVIVFE